jgi:hypothetical protein
MSLTRWASGPFELILHAELHHRAGGDFDRRIALISFDNAIEVTITSYLSLHPIHRNGISFSKEDVSKWTKDYHTKLDYFLSECKKRTLPIEFDKELIIWYHNIRNDQYHGGGPTIPIQEDLEGIRKTALWVFSVLFDVPDAEKILEAYYAKLIKESQTTTPISREDALDRAIDAVHGMIEVAGIPMYASDVLYSYDPNSYREIGLELCNSKTLEGSE